MTLRLFNGLQQVTYGSRSNLLGLGGCLPLSSTLDPLFLLAGTLVRGKFCGTGFDVFPGVPLLPRDVSFSSFPEFSS